MAGDGQPERELDRAHRIGSYLRLRLDEIADALDRGEDTPDERVAAKSDEISARIHGFIRQLPADLACTWQPPSDETIRTMAVTEVIVDLSEAKSTHEEQLARRHAMLRRLADQRRRLSRGVFDALVSQRRRAHGSGIDERTARREVIADLIDAGVHVEIGEMCEILASLEQRAADPWDARVIERRVRGITIYASHEYVVWGSASAFAGRRRPGRSPAARPRARRPRRPRARAVPGGDEDDGPSKPPGPLGAGRPTERSAHATRWSA